MTSKTHAINESLSALVDGEHSELDLRRVLKAAETDDSVLTTWASYQRNSQIHSKACDALGDEGFLAGVRAAIEAEEQPLSVRSTSSSWRQFAAKGAVAACFTFAFLLGATQWPQETELDDKLATTDSTESTAVVPSGFELPPLTARTVSSVPAAGSGFLLAQPEGVKTVSSGEFVLSPEMHDQLQRMIMKHAEQTSATSSLGVLPFSRVNSSVDSE